MNFKKIGQFVPVFFFLGCSSTPSVKDPFAHFGRFNPELELPKTKKPNLKNAKSFSYRLIQTETSQGLKRNRLQDPDGNPSYLVGSNVLQVSTLNVMESYARDRLPYHRGVIYSLEPDYGFYMEQQWWKIAPIVSSKEIGVQLDAQIPLPYDALDQTLQLEPNDPSFIFVVKWLYHERSTSSLLGITDPERQKFRERLLNDYYSKAVPAVRRKYPGRLILSQPFTPEELNDPVIREVTMRYCDLLLIRYPKEKRLVPEELKAILNPLKRPVLFVDVPVTQDLKVVVPLLSHLKVVGWQWSQEQPLSDSEMSWVTKLENAIPKVVHYLDTEGTPSNY